MTDAPDTLIGLAAVVIIQLVVLAVAIINARQSRGANTQLRDQLQNGSDGKFRNVFDQFATDVTDRLDSQAHDIRELRKDIGSGREEMREEIRAERKDRKAAIEAAVTRLQQQLDRKTRP